MATSTLTPFMKTIATSTKFAGAAAALMLTLAASPALADPPGDDMLKPDEVDLTTETTNPKNASGAFVGAGLGFGQARSTEGGASPGLGYFAKFEPGYQMHRGTFGRLEVSGEFLSGSLAFRTDDSALGKVKVPVGLGFLAKIGYGYSLGNKMFGLARFGVGPLLGKVEVMDGDFKSDTVTGLGVQLGWLMILPMSESLDATGGISWTHAQFDVGDIAGVDVDRNVIVNVPQIDVGLRWRI